MHARRVPSRRHGGAANASPSAGHVNFPTTLQVSPRNLDSMSLGAGLLATVAVSALGYYLRDKFPEGLGFRRRVQRALNNIYANPIPFDEGGNDPRAVNTELQRYMQAHVRLQQNPDSVLDPYGEERIEGLANIGNTCYMNSLIQALCSMTGFGEYLRELQSLRPQSDFVQHMVRFYQGRDMDPQEFHNIIARYTDQFGGYDQQDAHELFGFVVAILAEEMGDGRRLQEHLLARSSIDDLEQYISAPTPDENETPEKETPTPQIPAGGEASKKTQQKNPKSASRLTHQNSVLARPLNPFAGLESNILQCDSCNNISPISHESFTSLLVNVNNQGGNVLTSLRTYTRPESLQGVRCEFCGAQATMKHLQRALNQLERTKAKMHPVSDDEEDTAEDGGKPSKTEPDLWEVEAVRLKKRQRRLCERICEIDARCYNQCSEALDLPDPKNFRETELEKLAPKFEKSAGDGEPVGGNGLDPRQHARELLLTPPLHSVITFQPQPPPKGSGSGVAAKKTGPGIPDALLKELDVEDLVRKTFFRKQLCFARLPKLLCIHINRLMGGYKDSSWVSFPPQLDLSSFQKTALSRYGQAPYPNELPRHLRQRGPKIRQEDDSDQETAGGEEQKWNAPGGRERGTARYRLSSVVVHLGAAGGGHFITYRRRRPVYKKAARVNGKKMTQEWVRISDSQVVEVSEDTVLRSEAYLLFYERV